jgi:hypothetical protein
MSPELSTKNEDDAAIFTGDAAAAYLREKGWPVKDSTIRTLRQRGLGPTYYRIAGRALYRLTDLDEYVASCRVDSCKRGEQVPPCEHQGERRDG